MGNTKLSRQATILIGGAALLLFIIVNIAIGMGAFSLGEWLGSRS